MGRGLRQTAHGGNQWIALECSDFYDSLPRYQFRQSRCARYRRHAAFRFESDFLDTTGVNSQTQTKHVAAGGILNFRRRVSVQDLARVARILEIVEQSGRVHRVKL